ncbi:hypothetical protein VTN02DRAFT_3102 [Thermoascus thermophilus]
MARTDCRAPSRRRSSYQTAPEEGPFAITWLTQTPTDIRPSDVLSHLPTASHSSIPANVPVLLVTPAFASWIDPSNSFLEDWVNTLFTTSSDHSPQSPLYAVAAVVDKLPDPRNSIGDVKGVSEGTAPVSSESDGLSLLLARGSDVLGKVAEPSRFGGTGTEEPVLVHSIQPARPAVNAETFSAPYTVGLRLANTVFINGNDRTMFGMRWNYDSAAGRFSLNQCLNLSSCTVVSSANSVRSSLELPLYPVSRRRKVISSMGNILRQVSKSADGESDEPMPASLELEESLPRYLAEHHIVNRRVSVWALVEQSDCSPLTETNNQEHVARAIRKGNRLHRVVSGGGGWGKKQGLLSLDPETNFAEAHGDSLVLDELFRPSGATTAQEEPLDLPVLEDIPSLSQIAKPGDYIQFFVSVEPEYRKNDSSGAMSCHFGVSIVRETPQLDAAERGHSKDLAVLPGYFGALSEKAITYSQPVQNAGSTDEGGECCTKLDIPGCRVTLVSV